MVMAPESKFSRLLAGNDRLLAGLERARFVPTLLVRLFVGYMFFETGWSKVQNLGVYAERMAGWGLPHPHLMAALSAYTEMLGGGLVIIGLATRLVSIP